MTNIVFFTMINVNKYRIGFHEYNPYIYYKDAMTINCFFFHPSLYRNECMRINNLKYMHFKTLSYTPPIFKS